MPCHELGYQEHRSADLSYLTLGLDVMILGNFKAVRFLNLGFQERRSANSIRPFLDWTSYSIAFNQSWHSNLPFSKVTMVTPEWGVIIFRNMEQCHVTNLAVRSAHLHDDGRVNVNAKEFVRLYLCNVMDYPSA